MNYSEHGQEKSKLERMEEIKARKMNFIAAVESH